MKNALESPELAALEKELCDLFDNYQHSINDMRILVMEYESKESRIRNLMKRVMQNERKKIKI